MSSHETGLAPEAITPAASIRPECGQCTADGCRECEAGQAVEPSTADRLDALERMIFRQQEELIHQANAIALLKISQHDVHTRIGAIERRESDVK